ncbi:hypothetical protein IWQ49_002844 [Labrenzia sp. EL_126]|nr:hypothetical protein [Labrenzia sp. EL_126]
MSLVQEDHLLLFYCDAPSSSALTKRLKF